MFLEHLLYFVDRLIINFICMIFDILNIFLLHTICLFNTCIVNWIVNFICIANLGVQVIV